MAWVIVWVGLGLAVGLWVAATHGRSAATEYFAAYLLEESLSVDNIFVFVVIFSELHIPAEYQRRVLLFGVAGALVFRALAIGAGHHAHRTLSMDHLSIRNPHPVRRLAAAVRCGT